MVDYPCIPHPFAALQVYCYTFSLDLHVLGAPPAFVLSQDQTLIKVLLELDPRATSSIHLTHFSLYSVVKELLRASEELFVPHASRALYYAGLTLSRGSEIIFLIGAC